ncbi:hypothetical protein G6K88_14160 [Agrobacterium rhizogenes]|uniref:hypothetical protein n=1 Tax=Rhizobium rhizogenes TaxID=359 RepID=UPI00115CAEA1|nr:hypothetical protein [Rhizobium rhizogenes]NTI03164.1 hypothetical protein [Rhizobium rhizogenes]NTI09968.1 hypothetical protein [Rhizobium rhizogenes]TRB21508.1 hypothetical protein EXN70_21615 [Rhizobium rhizogenes]
MSAIVIAHAVATESAQPAPGNSGLRDIRRKRLPVSQTHFLEIWEDVEEIDEEDENEPTEPGVE